MDIKHIFLIVGKGWTKEQVENELIAEGYQDKFAFNLDNPRQFTKGLLVDMSDEIWIFGEVDHLPEYQWAIELGKDIWRMG